MSPKRPICECITRAKKRCSMPAAIAVEIDRGEAPVVMCHTHGSVAVHYEGKRAVRAWNCEFGWLEIGGGRP